MKSVVCCAPKTMSGNLYVIFRLRNHGPTSLNQILVCSFIPWHNFEYNLCFMHPEHWFFGFLNSLNILSKSKHGQTLLVGPFRAKNHQHHCQNIIPLWTNRLHTVQLQLISAILDGQDILCCAVLQTLFLQNIWTDTYILLRRSLDHSGQF